MLREKTSTVGELMFKLAHFSDLHAGYKSTRLVNAQGINLREADGYLILSKMVDQVIESEVDAVVVCGDIFHSPTPEIRAIIFVQNSLRRLAKANIPVYILAGNHDTNDIRSDIAASRVLHDPWRNIYSHAEPYVKHEIADGINLHLISHHMFGEQSDTMSKVKPVENEINILSTHGSIFDTFLHETVGAEQSPREIVIPEELLADHDWSYSLFGHIHERGWVGSSDQETDTAKSRIYYNGSAIRRGFSDKAVPLGRGWTLWEIDDFGNFEAFPQQIDQRPQYDFQTIDALSISASDITEMIIKSLKDTQVDGTNFDQRAAPILRQKLINLTPSKYSAIDWKNVSYNSEHAMVWKVDSKTIAEGSKGIQLSSSAITNDNSDVVKGYDDWVSSAKSLEAIEKMTKEKVIEQARKYVKLGQEVSLDAE